MDKASVSPVQQKLSERSLIVVVDDEQDLLDLYEMMLSPLGEVIAFSSPEKFIKKMKSDPFFRPDVIITDYLMPNMTGGQMIEAIQDPENPIPAILLSGFLDKEKSISAVNAGICNILEKPVVKHDLVMLTKELLLESRNKKIQAEIIDVMTKLKEIFLWFRITCVNELELKAIHDPTVLSGGEGPAGKMMSLEETLEDLEEQFARLSSYKVELSGQLHQVHSLRKSA